MAALLTFLCILFAIQNVIDYVTTEILLRRGFREANPVYGALRRYPLLGPLLHLSSIGIFCGAALSGGDAFGPVGFVICAAYVWINYNNLSKVF